MRSIELVVGTPYKRTVIPIASVWAEMLLAHKASKMLQVMSITHGVEWDEVTYAHIEVNDPDNGKTIHNLL
jgi:hypothetical protein